jgi:phosphohistidine phosphatase SixA
MLLVVRHADAGDKRSWTGPDRLRPLSPTGCRQAEGLLIRLEDYPIDRILSSPTLRSSRPSSRSPMTGKGPAASRHQQQVPAAAENR